MSEGSSSASGSSSSSSSSSSSKSSSSGRSDYGAIETGAKKTNSAKEKEALSMGLSNIAICIILPLLIFIVVYYVRCMSVRYKESSAHYLICAIALLVVLALGGMAFTSNRNGDNLKAFTMALLFICCLIAWVSAFTLGDYDYQMNMQPYYDIRSLNSYQSVDPSLYRGQQLMDAGEVEFVPGTHLDLSLSYGFKMGDVFCIAPIVGPNQTTGKKDDKRYDFWAIGLNCCSGHAPDFHCGEFSNPKAHKGLRLMRDDYRGYYRLAAQEAEATYNIKAVHPVFMYWMESPSDEVKAYQDDGIANFVLAVCSFAGAQVGVAVLAAFVFNRVATK